MTMKRLMLVWVMMLCLVPLSGWAEEIASEEAVKEAASETRICGNYEYIVLEDGTAEIVEMGRLYVESTDPPEELTIPAELDGIPVTVIGWPTLRAGVKKVIIPEGITTLRQFTLGSSTVRTVELPRSLVSVEDGAFWSCENLQEIKLAKDHPALEYTKGMLFSREDGRLIRCLPRKTAKRVTVPKGTTVIGMYAFADCKEMQSVTIPDSVTEIRRGAFSHCENLRSVSVPGSVKVLGRGAFSECKRMKSVKLGEGLETLGYFAFSYCDRLEKINLPRSLTNFGVNPFLGCNKLKTVTLAKDHPTLKMVKSVLFDKSGETLLWYPSRLTAKSYAIPDGTRVIAPQAFHFGKFRTVTIPDTVTEIGNYAFSECKNLRQIDLPDSVTELGNGAFELCSRLTIATLPNNLAELPETLFFCCDRLETIVLPDGISGIPYLMFGGCTAMNTLTLPASVTVIGQSAFEGCESLESLVLPEGLREIGDYAFLACKSLPGLRIPAGVTFIGKDAFRTARNRFDRDVIPFTAIVSHGSYAEQYCQEQGIPYEYTE